MESEINVASCQVGQQTTRMFMHLLERLRKNLSFPDQNPFGSLRVSLKYLIFMFFPITPVYASLERVLLTNFSSLAQMACQLGMSICNAKHKCWQKCSNSFLLGELCMRTRNSRCSKQYNWISITISCNFVRSGFARERFKNMLKNQ